jgi:ribonuclease Z
VSISYTILGNPGEDNALYVVVDTGQSRHPLLFDCGEGCTAQLKVSQCQAIEHLCFSHFHMDHIAGFDSFFRHNYNRPEQPVHVWGPEQTIDVMHHRFRGFSWNLHHDQPGEWRVHEIGDRSVKEAAFLTAEAFASACAQDALHQEMPYEGAPRVLVDDAAYRLEAMILNHGSTPSIGFKVIEPERQNIDPARLEDLGIQPGPWLAEVSDRSLPDTRAIDVAGETRVLGALRDKLLVRTSGSSLAYLTDFALTGELGMERERLVEWLKHTDTFVCEAQYRHDDADLAAKNYHMTTRLVGELARDAEVGKLILQHVSRRYSAKEWRAMLAEAKEVFAAAEFPDHWAV